MDSLAILCSMSCSHGWCRSVVQFQYGEDGIDVLNASFLKEFGFHSRNVDRLQQQQLPGTAQAASKAAALNSSMEKEAAKISKYAMPKLCHLAVILMINGKLIFLCASCAICCL